MKKRGFTLIELLVAIAIIGLLSTLVIVRINNARDNAKLSRISMELSTIATAVNQYAEDNNYAFPIDVGRGVPPGLEPYLANGTWPKSIWPQGVFDWDNWTTIGGVPVTQPVYQITYRLCDLDDPEETCRDPRLFPNFVRNSAIFYCISGSCVPHQTTPTVPGYCTNCRVHEVNY